MSTINKIQACRDSLGWLPDTSLLYLQIKLSPAPLKHQVALAKTYYEFHLFEKSLDYFILSFETDSIKTKEYYPLYDFTVGNLLFQLQHFDPAIHHLKSYLTQLQSDNNNENIDLTYLTIGQSYYTLFQ